MNYYPFGAEFGDGSAKNYNQKRKYNGKEFDNMHGLNTYDYGARQYNPVTARWDRMDPLAENYSRVSPYVYCLNNPVKYIDPDGNKVYLFATKLPGTHVPFATHTFIVVSNGKGIRYAAYGPENGNPFGRDRLAQCWYKQDIQVYKDFFTGKKNENNKKCQPVPVPENMTSEEFDNKVIETINSFGNNSGIKYNIFPTGETEGNCNTSSSTILLKAGVSEEEMKKLEENIPDINTGFETQKDKAKPWTKEEQEKAVQDKH